MEIDEECIQFFFLNMVFCFHAFSFGNGLNKFQFETIQQFMKPKVVLPKPTLMNHHN